MQREGNHGVPTVTRWPGVIEPGAVINEMGPHEAILSTLLTAAGEPDIKEKRLPGGVAAMARTCHVHLDGYNLPPASKGAREWPREEFLYWTDGGDLAALGYDQWKVHFLQQGAHGFDVWGEPSVQLRLPMLYTLLGDPLERVAMTASCTIGGASTMRSCRWRRKLR